MLNRISYHGPVTLDAVLRSHVRYNFRAFDGLLGLFFLEISQDSMTFWGSLSLVKVTHGVKKVFRVRKTVCGSISTPIRMQ